MGDNNTYKFNWFGNNRVLCDVLSDMRKCIETLNFAMMKSLIEEAQIMGTRMESALSDQKDLKKLNVEYSRARRSYKALERKYRKLETKVNKKRPKSKKK